MTAHSIQKVTFENFAQFSDMELPFARHINVISGENGVGKTNMMKALYCVGKTMNNMAGLKTPPTLEKQKELVSDKLLGVYRPDTLGRLVKRKKGRNKATCKADFYNAETVTFSVTTQNNFATLEMGNFKEMPRCIFIPPKEIISATENFAGLYEEYHITFEETYYDLNKLLLLPAKKGAPTTKQQKLISTLEDIVDGKVTSKNQKFYLKTKGIGEIEMGLLAEGYRKLATLLQLISNGVLSENSILFWDEPETNINPKMIPSLKNLLVALSEMGVQIFITTHSYFLQQELSLFAQYQNKDALDIQFTTLYFDEERNIRHESKPLISELEHNPIQEEFENLYNREQDMFYES